jgi:hypothetical protein
MNSKKILVGIILLVTFFIVLFIIFMPWFGKGATGQPRNGLEFSDDFFNSLAKSSSNFMESMRTMATPFKGQTFEVELKVKDDEAAKKAELLLTKAGATVEAAGSTLKVKGDLGQVMFAAINDSDALFNNQGDKLKTAYGADAKGIARSWWNLFKDLGNAFTKQSKFREAKVLSEIQKRSIEPAYNFYGIVPTPVREQIPLLTFMLVFYVIYTLWYGYGVFELFEGLGLGAHAGHKEEV